MIEDNLGMFAVDTTYSWQMLQGIVFLASPMQNASPFPGSVFMETNNACAPGFPTGGQLQLHLRRHGHLHTRTRAGFFYSGKHILASGFSIN